MYFSCFSCFNIFSSTASHQAANMYTQHQALLYCGYNILARFDFENNQGIHAIKLVGYLAIQRSKN